MEDKKYIKVAEQWINERKEIFKFTTFTEKELIKIGKNILNNGKIECN